MLRPATYLVAVAVISSFLAPGLAAEKNASELELKTERAIIFKDGYALIIKRGVATTDKAGEVFTDEGFTDADEALARDAENAWSGRP